MAEEITAAAPKAVGTPPVRKGMPTNTMMMMAGGVVLVVIIALVGMFFRPSFSGAGSSSQSKYVPVFTRLELKEAATIRDELDKKGIKTYRIEDNGQTISILRKDADNARLAMALQGLPMGGGVGFEIFDKGGALGATDFDKRIKLMRALNGELARNVSRVFGIDEARVQIVLPEKQLFETKKVPVTAAVFLKTGKGLYLDPLQVKGIIHLVASSVEELATENVTVVEYSGRILSSPDYEEFYAGWAAKQEQEKARLLDSSRKGKVFATAPVEQTTVADTGAKKVEITKAMTPQEKMEARLRYKRELEKSLETKAQSVLDQFFPASSSVIKINVELKTFDESPADDSSAVAKISSIVLLDENNKSIVLTPEMQEAMFKAVGMVIGFMPSRDRIDLRWAPIGNMGGSAALQGALGEKAQNKTKGLMALEGSLFGKVMFYGIILLALYIGFNMIKSKRSGRKEDEQGSTLLSPQGRGLDDMSQLQGPTVDDFKSAALKDPQKLADALKLWLAE